MRSRPSLLLLVTDVGLRAVLVNRLLLQGYDVTSADPGISSGLARLARRCDWFVLDDDALSRHACLSGRDPGLTILISRDTATPADVFPNRTLASDAARAVPALLARLVAAMSP